jgi:sigma-B regulation protein RsbU (phosphoserine phosphatase)
VSTGSLDHTPPTPARELLTQKSTFGTAPVSVVRGVPNPPRVLIAEDDKVSRTLLERTLRGWGNEVVVTSDGKQAWDELIKPDAPSLVILDWMMPGIEGPELCRRVRALARPVPSYVILLTAKGSSSDIVQGLDSGADDFVTKPFDRTELRARLRVGQRVIGLKQGLVDRVHELEVAIGQVKQLKGLLPMCAYCKKIRDNQDYWQRVETYISCHSDARFSHGICPTCWTDVVEPELRELKAKETV